MNKINYLKAGLKFIEFKILGKYTSTWCWHNPLHAEIDITGKCNFNCVWCFRQQDSPDNKHADIDHVIDVIHQLKGCQRINLCALGEPLLVPVNDVKRIIEASVRSADETILTTNGSLLKGEMAKMLAISPLDKLAVSIDHFDFDKFNDIRGFDLDIIKDNVKRFRRMFDGEMQMNVVMTEQTMDDMPGMVTFGHELGMNTIIFQPVKLHPDSNIIYTPPVGIYKNRMIVERIRKRANEYGIKVVFHNMLFNYPMHGLCKQPFYQLAMDVNGYINPCCADKSEHIIHIDKVREAWNHPKVMNFRKRVLRGPLPHICSTWCDYVKS